LLLFRNILSGRIALNIEAPTRQALRQDFGYQKYVTRPVIGVKRYKKKEKKEERPEMAV
jgi:hypothetical protein